MAKTKGEIHYLKELEKLGGKFKCTHAAMYDGRRRTIVVLKIKGIYYMDSADCSFKDTFSRKIGRALALKRAMLDYRDNKPHNPPEALKFSEDRKNQNEQKNNPRT